MLEVEKDNLCIHRIVGEKVDNIMVEGDVIVPDIKPDCLRVIHTSGNVCIYKKEVLDGKVKIEGCINTYVMYLADDEQNSVRSLNTSIGFTEIFQLEEAKVGMSLEEQTLIKQIDCNILNGRKVNVKVGLEVRARVYSNDTIEFMKQMKEQQDIQVLQKGISIHSLKGDGNSRVYAKDTLMLDNVDNLAEVLKVDFTLINKDTKISYNKVLAKADAIIKILYLTEDGRIGCVQGNIPVMGFIDIPEVTDENICDMKYELKNIVVKPNSVEEHSIYVEAEIEIACKAYEDKQMEMIQDLYSITGEVEYHKTEVETITEKQIVRNTCSIRQTTMIPEINGNKIYDVEIYPVILKQSALKDRAVYEGEVTLKFIFSSDVPGRIDTKTVTLPYEFNADITGMNNTSEIATTIDVNMDTFVLMPDGNMDIKIDLGFEINICKKVSLSIIQEITLKESRDINIYSVTIYFVKPGDTLWNIAKKFRSTVDAIAKLNGIEDVDNLKVGEQLFIPKYVGGSKGAA